MTRPAGLVVTEELVRRIEATRAAQYCERMAWIARITGNPWGAETRRFGPLTAIRSEGYDTVYGLDDATLPAVDEVIEWYAAFGVEPDFDVMPLPTCAGVGEALAARGFRVVAQQSILCGPARANPVPTNPGRPTGTEPSPPVRVLPRSDAEFAEVWRVCYGDMPQGPDWPKWERRVIATYGSDRFRRFAIDVDGAPAALGISHHPDDGIAYLANAGTAPPYRRRGLHAELLRVRIDTAAREGFTMVAGDAVPYSGSQRNMERAGMRIAYQKLRWRRPCED